MLHAGAHCPRHVALRDGRAICKGGLDMGIVLASANPACGLAGACLSWLDERSDAHAGRRRRQGAQHAAAPLS
jgi:hypothetical protein